jgi:hypothetical protein
MSAERLVERHLLRSSEAVATLTWMIEGGLLLRSLSAPGGIAPTSVPAAVALPLFTFQRLPPLGVDFVVSA